MVDNAARPTEKTDDANTIPGPIGGAHLTRIRAKESNESADCSYDKTDGHDAEAGMLGLTPKQLEPKNFEFALRHIRCLTLELSGRAAADV